MSLKQLKLGAPIGGDYGAFIALEQNATPGEGDAPIYVKLTPGTNEYNMVKHVKTTMPGITGPKVIRLLLKTGYLSFKKSLDREAE